MPKRFTNVYDDRARARAYAELEFPATYYLAFRDIPRLLAKHVAGTRALDFGCGAGRSSRFLRDQGFDVIGVDISEAMLAEAAARDPQGTYLRLTNNDFGPLGSRRFDLIFAAFTFDNIPGHRQFLHSPPRVRRSRRNAATTWSSACPVAAAIVSA
jgi:ubiquinone/menaquinone biosynthesis C-methylase UbiE